MSIQHTIVMILDSFSTKVDNNQFRIYLKKYLEASIVISLEVATTHKRVFVKVEACAMGLTEKTKTYEHTQVYPVHFQSSLLLTMF